MKYVLIAFLVATTPIIFILGACIVIKLIIILFNLFED